MKHYIVMQGKTYEEERNAKIIWSPQEDKNGNIPHSWLRMKEVNEGDRIFHYVKGEIVAMSVALSNCEVDNKPSSLELYEQWGDAGFLVKLNYYELEKPLSIRKYFEEIQPVLPTKYSPFQQNGSGNQGYLYPCNDELAIKLIDVISDENLPQFEERGLESENDTERNKLISVIKETETEAKRKIRIGQNQFKKALTPLWNNQCALCNVKLPALLRASHSKPWKDCSNEERLNPYNGVLLCSNHDVLYDRGYITFDETGKIQISEQIPEEDYSHYHIKLDAQITSFSENKPFFNWHRTNIFN